MLTAIFNMAAFAVMLANTAVFLCTVDAWLLLTGLFAVGTYRLGKRYGKASEGKQNVNRRYGKRLARLRARKADIYILDEPSSAMDPLAEARLFRQLWETADGKTTVFISHRLISAKYADMVLLLDNGRVVEAGSHRELLRKGGLYAELYAASASYYQNDGSGGRSGWARRRSGSERARRGIGSGRARRGRGNGMKKNGAILFTLKFIARRFPYYFGISLLYHIVVGTMPAVHNVWIYYLAVDILDSGKPAVRLLALVALLIVYSAVTGIFCRWYEEIYEPGREESLADAVRIEVLGQAVKLDMRVYDDPGFYNDVVLNLDGTHEKLVEIMRLCMMMAGSILSVIMSLTVYAGAGMACLGVLLVFVGVSVRLSGFIAGKQFARKEKMVPWERKRAYFSGLLLQRTDAQDVRLYGADRIFRAQYDDAVVRIREAAARGGAGVAFWGFVQGFVIEKLILYFGTMLYLAYEVVVAGTIGLAQFAAAFKGVSVIADALGLIFGRYLSQLHECGLFADRFRKFMERESGKGEEETAVRSGAGTRPGQETEMPVLLDDVVFHYPGCENNVIDHLSLTIPAGKRVAVVGLNGAGKSTGRKARPRSSFRTAFP